jgi:mannose-6-phosphate isomerase-like protein (cupin superfamily)
VPTRWQLEARFRQEGLTDPRWWSNGPADRYERHHHPYHKVLYCAEGSIVFHVDGDDVALGPGDRLDIDAGTDHSASVGPVGVTCVEASRGA